MDRLAALFNRFTVSARTFRAGGLCGVNAIGEDEPRGQLHVVREGPLQIEHLGPCKPKKLKVGEPSLLLYPRPMPRRFITDPERGANLVCAHIEFQGGAANPIAAALPDVMQLPLSSVPEVEPVLSLLFAEADAHNCGRQAMLDRLFEVLLIQVLRALMEGSLVRSGMLAGLADSRLRNALVSIHEKPQRNWSLEELAAVAGMSRTAFANAFRETVGVTPGAYLQTWRVGLAQELLDEGHKLKHIAAAVGYSGEAALSRAFRAHTGTSPGQWQRARAGEPAQSAQAA
ncbi:AraC family transcriptional regulator [Paucibacter sp. R3-3]|uniref:AraC family transcriptional regulator n=1 Tax=Roseateles agri TaxID=3098619 RepID=A0ABU5DGE8_9BURK|nr:AraC family transcriptional regulator [Paucibacter sp. R3-3]MDY0745360.1 AraC family transcriptional regulator [Paucibacter sp. R3-3]